MVRLADSVQTLSTASDISGVLGGTNTWSAAAIPLGTTVNPINDAPVITALSGTPATVEQQATPVRLDGDGNVTVFDRELSGGNWNGANLTVRRSGRRRPDVFSMIDDSGTAGDGSGVVEISGGNLLVDGVNIGSVTNAGGTLRASDFNASATDALVGEDDGGGCVSQYLRHAARGPCRSTSISTTVTVIQPAAEPAAAARTRAGRAADRTCLGECCDHAG